MTEPPSKATQEGRKQAGRDKAAAKGSNQKATERAREKYVDPLDDDFGPVD